MTIKPTLTSKMQSLVNLPELTNSSEEDEWTVQRSENDEDDDENLLQFKKISISRSQSTPFPLIVQPEL